MEGNQDSPSLEDLKQKYNEFKELAGDDRRIHIWEYIHEESHEESSDGRKKEGSYYLWVTWSEEGDGEEIFYFYQKTPDRKERHFLIFDPQTFEGTRSVLVAGGERKALDQKEFFDLLVEAIDQVKKAEKKE